MHDAPLADFEARSITLEGTTRTVYRAGSGPAVIVMAEMPGISPHVARFARWVRDAGFTVFMPSLFDPVAEASRLRDDLRAPRIGQTHGLRLRCRCSTCGGEHMTLSDEWEKAADLLLQAK